MKFVISLGEDESKVYYVNYTVKGPLCSFDLKDAHVFPTRSHAENVVHGDVRLKDAKIEEYAG